MSLRRPNGFISAGYDPLEVPNAPTIGVATATGPTSLSVTFTAPSNVGGSAITGYVATAKKTSDGTTISGTGSSSPVTISGLTTGDAYTVTVAAVNSYGLGVSSAASNSVTPLEEQLWSWGSNSVGQLGLNDTANRSSPVQVGAQIDWNQVTAGGYHSVVTKKDGTLWSWGSGSFGKLGQNNTISLSSPVQIGALTTWYQVAGGGYHFSVATTNGYALWAWGSNGYGQLGQNDIANRSSPVQVGALTTWYQVAAGRGTVFAIKLDGTLWGWGRNGNGELGLNNAANRSSPVQIGALTNWYQVAAGSRHTLAIKADGTLWSWGYNSFGQLGLNDTTERSSPVQVGALTNWYQVVGGYNHTLAIKNDGSLWAWGLNGTGELGIDLGAGTDRSSPVQVGALTTWLQVAGGRNFSLAIKTDNTLWSWGQNSYGKLGQNNTANRSSPVQVGALTTWLRIPKMPMAQHSLAIRG